MDGRTLDVILSDYRGTMIGETLAGGGSDPIEVDLTPGADVRRLISGLMNCIDGGVTAWRIRSNSMPQTTRSAAGGNVQRLYRSAYACEVAIFVEDVDPSILAENVPAWERQLVNLIEAGLEPDTGARYNVQSMTLHETTYHPKAGSFIVLRVDTMIQHHWER